MSHPGLLLISTVIPIPEHIEVGKLIGREGRNLKPISAKTGTFVSVNTNTNPAQIEIKYNPHYLPFNNQINEVKKLLNNLTKNIEKEEKRNIQYVFWKRKRKKTLDI